MTVFENLPHPIRTLILGKLALETMHAGCGDIAELATVDGGKDRVP